MGFRSANRGVSEVVGAMLLFGVLVLGLGMYQVHVVPEEDSRVEFDHHEETRAEMRTLGNAVADAGLAGNGDTVEVQPTVRYPPRPLALQRAQSGGSFGATADETVRIKNLTATGPGSDYWDGSERTFDTSVVTHRPGYRHYKAPERTTIEPLAVHTQYDDGVVYETPKRLVNGHTISVLMVDGANRRTSRTKTLDVRSISTATEGIEAQGGFNVTVPTTLPESEWKAVLDDEPANLSNYNERSGQPNLATVETNPGETYTVKLAAVSLDGQTPRPDPKYLTAEGVEEATVTVYDEYGNPLADETVHIESPDGTVREDTTDDDGEVTFEPNTDGPHEIWVGADSYDEATNLLKTTIGLSTPGTGNGPADPINPGGPGDVRLNAVALDGNDVTLTFENLGAQERTVDEARINMYIRQPPGGDGGGGGGGGAAGQIPSQGTLYLSDGTTQVGVLTVGGQFVALSPSPEIPTTGTTDLVVSFAKQPNPHDWFVITMTFNDGTTAHYFVQVR